MSLTKYSVVHNGPIAYFHRLLPALQFARKCWRRKGFRCMGKWWRLKATDTLTVYNLETDNVVQVFDSKTQ